MIDERESVTAKICAFVRAWHSNTARQKIYDDYLAYDMLGKEEYDSIYELISSGLDGSQLFSREDTEQIISEYFAPIPLSRIHFNESRLADFAKKNGRVQYVICGAGSDTFSFRNDNEDIEIFEIDHPDTQRYKLEKIQKLEWNIRPNVHFVSVDFERERMCDKLLAAGFDPTKKTFFSILGVTYYLTLDVFTDTLKQMAELSALGSALVFDYPIKTGEFPRRVEKLENITEELGEVMRGGYDYSEVSRALYSLGFQIDTYMPPEKVQKEYFDGRQDGLKAFENVSLISAAYTAGYDYE
ncbi:MULTISPECIES: class I SAM-dependent methyltransferase [Ruminococcus]|uniref:S-adenosyl-L-methionine-dependent methyltransferase n=1 Tax=Ruminococcus flavefaciens TaxID=1265 RepID=A0A1M7LRG5_RUMFL|nr:MULTISPECIES: class I SAM-dependent methyltransferase [Ruminococcus]MCR4794063.1 class I SAM-dependent methyltransferase [Ruminococcus sp.]SHM80797.1 methyltransferase, TIGR00027 family [Ruminococcus flavefaciens]